MEQTNDFTVLRFVCLKQEARTMREPSALLNCGLVAVTLRAEGANGGEKPISAELRHLRRLGRFLEDFQDFKMTRAAPWDNAGVMKRRDTEGAEKEQGRKRR